MKVICRFIVLTLLVIAATNVFAQLTIVKAVIVDTNDDGDADAIEIQFNQAIDDSRSNDRNDDWILSNNSDASDSVVAINTGYLDTEVQFIASVNIADDEYARILFDNPSGPPLADDTDSPFYYLYVQTNSNDAVISLGDADTLRTMTIPVLLEDYSPPKINSSSVTEVGAGAKLAIDDTIKFELNLFSPESGVSISPAQYNGRNINWTTSDDSTYLGTYVVTEGDPDQASDLDLNGVTVTDNEGNESSSVNFNVLKGIDANRPTITSIFYSPGDGTVLGLDSVLTVSLQAENLETGLTCDSAMVNGVDVSASFSETGSGYYTVQYTVQSGHASIDDNTEAIPVLFELSDGLNSTLPLYEDSTVLSSPGVDNTAPLVSAVTLSPSTGISGIGDTIIFTISAGEDGLSASNININGKDLINKFSSVGSGDYEVEYVVKSGDTDIDDALAIPISIILKDASGNISNNFTTLLSGNCPEVDGSIPDITTVGFSPSTGVLGIGDLVTLTITASESNLLADSISVNGKSFSISGTGPYTIAYTIVEGDNDVSDSSPIPIYFTLSDGANTSAAFKTSDIAFSDCPGIDANRPVIVSAIFSPGDGNTVGIDSILTVTLEAKDGETGLTASAMSVNGVDVIGSFIETGSGHYTVNYTVQAGNGSINDANQAIPVSFVLNDGENLTSPAYTNSTIASTPGIDDMAPVVSNVTVLPAFGMQGIDNTITFTITAGENGLSASTITINGKDLINKFSAIGSNQYEVEYIVESGDTYRSDATAIPISIVLKDASGNVSNNYTSLAAGASPGVDANSPNIASVAVPDSKMLYGQTYTLTIETNIDATDTWSLVSGNVAGFNLFNLQKQDFDTYEADFTVGNLGYDILPGDSYDVSNLVLSDPSGNLSNNYSTSIIQANDPMYTILPTAKTTGNYDVCDKDSAELVFQLTGNAPWDIELSDGTDTTSVTVINASPFIYKVEAVDLNGLIEPDTVIYKITQVTDVNGNIVNISATDSAMVFAHEVPVADITQPPGNNTYNINAEVDTLIGSPVGGIFSGNGIVPSNNTFLASSAGLGTHPIVYKYTIPSSGCYDSDTALFQVIESDADITFDNSDDDWRCDYETTMDLTAEVVGKPGIIGSLRLLEAPAALTDWGNNTATVDIKQLSGGNTYTIGYKYVDGSVTTIYRSFTVEKVGSSLTSISNVCEDHDTIFVNAFNLSPTGGTGQYFFSGNTDDYFVNDPNGNNIYFYPDSVDPGSYNLKYVYTSPNGCNSDTIEKTFDVYSLPAVSFTMDAVYNIDHGISVINGSPLGATGVFTPLSFMSNNGDGTANFDPADAGLGTWWVKYTFEDANSCANSDSTQIQVNEALGSISSSSGSFQFCYWNTTIDTLIGVPDPTDGTPGSFYIDNNLITPESDNKILFNPKDYAAGDHTVKFEYNDGPTVYNVSKTVNIDSIGTVFFTDLTDKCEDYDTVFVDAFNLAPAGGTGEYVFSGSSTSFEYDPADPDNTSGYLMPGRISPGSYNLKFVYASPVTGCKSDTVTKAFEVNSLPTVSLSMNNSYNIDQGSVLVNGNPLGTTGVFAPLSFMSNNGDGTAVFEPADAGLGFHWVRYTYEDGNACVNSDSVQIEVNEALGEITSSSGTFNFCYFNPTVDTLIGVPDPTDGSPGRFYIDNQLITPESDNRILINPQDYTSGNHTVRFEYDNGPAPYEVYKTITIDSIGNIYFTGLDAKYCENLDQEIELTAFYTGQDGQMQFGGNGITDNIVDNLGYFNPSDANVGTNFITYTFTRDYSGCRKAFSQSTTINKAPYNAFRPDQRCIIDPTDPVSFTADTLDSDTIVMWDWRFRNAFTSAEVHPQFNPVPGYNTMSLTLETNHGCSLKVDSVFYIGTRVDLDFIHENECHGETVVFELLSSTDDIDVDSVKWRFGGDGIADLSDLDNPTYQYTNPGAYDVIYEEYTKSCGILSDTQRVNVRPSIDLSDGNYIEDFEDSPNTTGWVIEDYELGANNSWEWGVPSGIKINNASSGVNAYVTNLNGNYANNEKGMITSPCFDFSGLNRPMMKIDIVSYSEKDRDGAVIQYTKTDGSWATIGVPEDGVSWYNSYIISGAPANQQLGWTAEIINTNGTSIWQTARYKLDDLIDRAGVRFRIVYGSNGDFVDEGFAFDNIWFGERKRMVLLENFTNTADDAANQTQNDIVDPIIENNTLDVIGINYHASFPADNDLNSFYASGPSARALFYGVSAVPYSVIDGGERQFDYSVGNNLTEADINKRVLEDTKFNISIKQDVQGSNLVVSSTVTALEDITNQDISIHVAIVEKSVVSGANMHSNVLRAMLPDAAGLLFSDNWLINDSSEIYQTWAIPTGVNPDSLIAIVFVQDEESKEIYQTAFTDEFNTITSVDKVISEIAGVDYMVYPNPAQEQITLKLLNILDYDLNVNLYNNMGLNLKSGLLVRGNNLLEINVKDLPAGIYYLKLENQNEFFSTKKVLIGN